VLELFEPAGAFGAIESYLTEQRFWGSAGLVADL
jgi:hypothetical protein